MLSRFAIASMLPADSGRRFQSVLPKLTTAWVADIRQMHVKNDFEKLVISLLGGATALIVQKFRMTTAGAEIAKSSLDSAFIRRWEETFP